MCARLNRPGDHTQCMITREGRRGHVEERATGSLVRWVDSGAMQRDMRRIEEMNAAERWAQALAAWAIPPEILTAAPESPWGFPTELFERRADTVPAEPTPSTQRALEALPEGGAVLDVGCGAGAASLPLAARAGQLMGVDPSVEMLRAFRQRGEAAGKAVTTIEGPWPAVAEQTPVADVVVCHHVAYNVPELAPFVQRLTDHARARAVMELTAQHP